jgi:hypothetical protein
MDARIGAPGDRETVPDWEDGAQRLAQRALDRPLAGLARPAAEVRAVVRER